MTGTMKYVVMGWFGALCLMSACVDDLADGDDDIVSDDDLTHIDARVTNPGATDVASSADEWRVTDHAPAPVVGRVINFITVGGSSPDREGRRMVGASLINDAAGETWYDITNKPVVTNAIADGCRRVWFHNPQGMGDYIPTRYSLNGLPMNTGMHFDQRMEALDSGFTWITDGYQEGVEALVEQGIDVTVYVGHPWSKDDTTGPPWNWPTDLSRSNMKSLAYWRRSLNEPLAGGAGGFGFDSTSMDFMQDTSFPLAQFLAMPGTHTWDGYAGSFPNDFTRRVYLEAVPYIPTTSWATSYSWVANYWVMEAWNNLPNRLHNSQAAYPPVWLFITVADKDDQGSAHANVVKLYEMAKAHLEQGDTVAVRWNQMRKEGMDMAALLAAAQ